MSKRTRTMMAGCLLLTLTTARGHSQERPATIDRATALNGEGSTRDERNREREVQTEESMQTMIFHLRSQPAELVAMTLKMALDQPVVVVPNNDSNSLIIRSTENGLKQCEEILQAIDMPRRMIHFDVEVRVAPAGDVPVSTDQIQFATLDNNQAKVQFGQQVSVATGTIQSPTREPVKQMQRQQIGTMVSVTPRIAGDEILADFQFEKSWFSSSADDLAPPTNNASCSSTIALKPGVPSTVVANIGKETADSVSVTITVTASFDKAEGH